MYGDFKPIYISIYVISYTSHGRPTHNLFGENSIFDTYLFFFHPYSSASLTCRPSSVHIYIILLYYYYYYIRTGTTKNPQAGLRVRTIIITIWQRRRRPNDDCYWNVKKKRAVIDSAIIIYNTHQRLFPEVGRRIRCHPMYIQQYSDCIVESKNPHARRKYKKEHLNPFSMACVCVFKNTCGTTLRQYALSLRLGRERLCPFFSTFHARPEHIGPHNNTTY